jgi:hypothetical protein
MQRSSWPTFRLPSTSTRAITTAMLSGAIGQVARVVAIQGRTRRDEAKAGMRCSHSNNRETVLKRDGTDVKSDDKCKATSGTWYSPYDGKTLTDASAVDIDHMVPLKNAWIVSPNPITPLALPIATAKQGGRAILTWPRDNRTALRSGATPSARSFPTTSSGPSSGPSARPATGRRATAARTSGGRT